MILYKYYGFQAGINALKSQKLGFREAQFFNDPFDLTYIDNSSQYADLERIVNFFKTNCAVLSLTRNPYNPLMWAHYGDEHRGFCIGYDIDDELLKSDAHNLIPVNDGDVIYTSLKEVSEIKDDFSAVWRNLQFVKNKRDLLLDSDEMQKAVIELLRKLLLYKHSAWSYEEEVRVVKVHQPLDVELGSEHGELGVGHFFSDPLNSFSSLSKEMAPGMRVSLVDGLYIFDSPVKIKEVYLGLRNPLLMSDTQVPIKDDSVARYLTDNSIETHKMIMSKGTWSVISEPCSYDIFCQRAEPSLDSFSFSGKELKFINLKLKANEISDEDRFEFSNFLGRYELKKNGEWQL